MHELGILVHMAKTLKSLAEENQLTEIGGITLEVGEVSGIVPEYMTDCWAYYRKKEDIMKNSELKIEITPTVLNSLDFIRQIRRTLETKRA